MAKAVIHINTNGAELKIYAPTERIVGGQQGLRQYPNLVVTKPLWKFTLQPPTDFSVDDAGLTFIDLSWTAALNADDYTIFVDETAGGTNVQTITGVTGTTHRVESLDTGTEYELYMVSVLDGEESLETPHLIQSTDTAIASDFSAQFAAEQNDFFTDHAALRLQGKWSLEVWINPDVGSAASRDGFLGKGIIFGNSSQYDWQCRKADGNIDMVVQTNNGGFLCRESGLDISDWVHLAWTYDYDAASNFDFKMYRDGTLVQTTEVTAGSQVDTDATQSGFWIGYTDGLLRDFIGKMDELRIWGEVRSPFQITNYMNSALNPGDHPNLDFYLKFDEGSGTTLNDEINSLPSNDFEGSFSTETPF